MDLLNTLLNVLSYGIAEYLFYLCLNIFYANKNRDKRTELILYASLFIVNSFLYVIFNNTIINLISNTFFLILIGLYYNRDDLTFKTILGVIGVTCVSYVFVALMETASIAIVENYKPAMDNSVSYLSITDPIYLYIFQYSIYLISGFILRTLINIRYTDELSIRYKLPLIIVPLITLYIVIFMLIDGKIDKFHITIIILLMYVLNLIFFGLYNLIGKFYKENMNKRLIEKENQAYLKQMEFAKLHQQKIVSIKHDMNHHLSTIREHINNSNYDLAKLYIGDIAKLTKNIKVLSKSGNIIVDTVLNDILTQCEAKNIEVAYSENVPQIFSVISDADINSLLYNALDNSILAACKLPLDKRKIDIKINYNKKKVLVISITNTYDGIIKVDSDNKLITIKKDKFLSGHGIKNITNIANIYNGNINIDYNNHTFMLQALLYDC